MGLGKKFESDPNFSEKGGVVASGFIPDARRTWKGRKFESDPNFWRAPIAQLDRALDYESKGRRFESCWARHPLHPESTMEPGSTIDDAAAMREALDQARRALSVGEVPVGAVAVHAGRVVGRGFNVKESAKDPTGHAEILAIRAAAAALGRWRLTDVTIYVTLEPCVMCAGAMVQARVGRLVYAAADPKAGACGSVYDVVRDPRLNHRLEVAAGVLEGESRSLLDGFFAGLRGPGLQGGSGTAGTGASGSGVSPGEEIRVPRNKGM